MLFTPSSRRACNPSRSFARTVLFGLLFSLSGLSTPALGQDITVASQTFTFVEGSSSVSFLIELDTPTNGDLTIRATLDSNLYFSFDGAGDLEGIFDFQIDSSNPATLTTPTALTLYPTTEVDDSNVNDSRSVVVSYVVDTADAPTDGSTANYATTDVITSTTITIMDDEVAVDVNPPATLSFGEGVASMSLAVSLNPAPTVELRITATIEGSDAYFDFMDNTNPAAVTTTNELVFASGMTVPNSPLILYATTNVDDDIVNSVREVTITYADTSTNTTFIGSSIPNTTVTIVDDESPVLDTAAPVLDTAAINRAVLPQIARAAAGHTMRAISARTTQVFSGAGGLAFNEQSLGDTVIAYAPRVLADHRNWQSILGGSQFVLPLNLLAGVEPELEAAAEDAIIPAPTGTDTGTVEAPTEAPVDAPTETPARKPSGSPQVSAWGGVNYSDLSGAHNEVQFDGTVTSLQFGIDTRRADGKLIGLALTRSSSDFDTTITGTAAVHELTLTSINPYFGWQTAAGSGWATFGLGTGDLSVGTTGSLGITMQNLGVGGHTQLSNDKLRFKGAVIQSRLGVDSAETFSAQQLRLGVEHSDSRPRGDGIMTPRGEISLRHDAGDGTTGTGLELIGSVSFANALTGVTTEGTIQALLGRSGYEEWNLAGFFRSQPNAAGRGLSFSVAPSWGNATSGIAAMWDEAHHLNTPIDALTNKPPTANARIDVHVAYGVGRQGVAMMPYHELSLSESAEQYRVGLRWETPNVELNLTGEQATDTVGIANRILLQGRVRF